MTAVPSDRKFRSWVPGAARVMAVLHLVAIPIILLWVERENVHERGANSIGSIYEPPGGVTFLMMAYLAVSGALFWAAVAEAINLLREQSKEN